MHWLVMLLQQLLGVLKGRQPASEPVRPAAPEARGGESSAYESLEQRAPLGGMWRIEDAGRNVRPGETARRRPRGAG